ncbi:Ppx/GppA phosphatase family protein [Constantimarinum furrinae]|uniref:Exopolyphosphatase n=1 Tax=Constantimarinum furrinae TaxID=2562285 RepID=A0A7G8PWZ5_9FLAO|nr:exopolyphosphatase [Constantimarinum furrinae]QNJ98861.1 exopolyphosphatase [Constantimarinum furrinae]
MLNIDKYAAIDIGSNAIRLLIASVVEQEGKDTLFKKTSLVRVPIRLGEDVFLQGRISDVNFDRMLESMKAFKLLMSIHNVKKFRACATSAMREAANGKEIAEKIYSETDLKINIIDGNDEAAIIATTDLKSLIKSEKTFLYVDVGGGSTEFTLYANGHTVDSRSFKLGTVRIINDILEDTIWDDVEEWIKESTKSYTKVSLIGSGGNINHIYKNSGKKIGKPLSYFYLGQYYDLVKSYSYEERITELNMNPDRADVILPATRIYLSAMKWSRAKNIYVPKIGLSDGIIKSLYNEKLAGEIEVDL